MEALDRDIINALQDGIEVVDHPLAAVAEHLAISETALLGRVRNLLDEGILTRFGPLYQAERLGGALTLCAMRVPDERFDEVTAIVNGFTEVAHNYRREHEFNMWFVLATETPAEIEATVASIERETGCPVFNMPKLDEYYVRLQLRA